MQKYKSACQMNRTMLSCKVMSMSLGGSYLHMLISSD